MALTFLLHIIWWSAVVSFVERFTQHYPCLCWPQRNPFIKVMSIDSDADIGGYESFSVEATNWCLVFVAMWRPWRATSWAGLNCQHRFIDDVGWFVPLLNIQPIQWVSSKVRSLISWWFIGFKVHWALSWLQPYPPKKPPNFVNITLFSLVLQHCEWCPTQTRTVPRVLNV